MFRKNRRFFCATKQEVTRESHVKFPNSHTRKARISHSASCTFTRTHTCHHHTQTKHVRKQQNNVEFVKSDGRITEADPRVRTPSKFVRFRILPRAAEVDFLSRSVGGDTSRHVGSGHVLSDTTRLSDCTFPRRASKFVFVIMTVTTKLTKGRNLQFFYPYDSKTKIAHSTSVTNSTGSHPVQPSRVRKSTHPCQLCDTHVENTFRVRHKPNRPTPETVDLELHNQ